MKNERIIASWDMILPDETADERMRSKIMEYQRKAPVINQNKAIKKLIPVAACVILIIVFAIFIGIQNPLLGVRQYTVTLDNGEMLVYRKGTPQGAASYAYDYEVKDRVLSTDELHMLFPTIANIEENGLPYATFKADTGELLRLEIIVDDIHIHIARSGLPATDTVIVGEESIANVEGITVTTGCFVTAANSKGIKTAIFFAEYEMNNAAIYMEIAGNEKDTQQLCEKLSNTLYSMICSHTPDTFAVKFE